MKWAYELLGLGPDADLAGIKRAYARLLRTTRPDEDPVAFQRLHAAYKAVLAHVNAQPAVAAEAVAPPDEDFNADLARSSSAPPRPARSDTVRVATPAIDLDTLAKQVIEAAMQAGDAKALSGWLHARQEFWSIQLKQQGGHRILHTLFQQPQAICTECMDALLRFFDLDHVLSGINPVALKTLRQRQMTLWQLLPAHHQSLAQQVGYRGLKSFRKDLALLQQPFSWPRVLVASISRTRGLGRLVPALVGGGSVEGLPASIEPRQARFWLRATARGPMSWPRFAVRSVHVALAALACAALVGVIDFLHRLAPVDPASPGRVDVPAALKAFAITGIVVFGIWLAFAGAVGFDRWQGLPESAPSRWPWLRRLVIPIVCACSFAMYATDAAPYAAWLVAPCFIFAVRRFWRRTESNSVFLERIADSKRGFIWLGVMVLSALSRTHAFADFPVVPVLAAATFGLSIADLWRHRAYLHPKLARN